MNHSHKPRRDGAIRILVAGGCHVVGFPAGVGDALTGILERELSERGVSIQTLGVPYVKLTHVDKVLTQCRSFRPDVIVLQLGHFELSRTLGTHLRKVLNRRPDSKEGTPTDLTGSVDNAYLFHARGVLKMCLDWFLRHPLVDFALLHSQLNQFLTSLRQGQCLEILLLSPLPCADPLFMSYRMSASRIFEQVARSHDCAFMDLTRTLPPGLQLRFGLNELSYNGSHLGREGLRMVSKPLADYLARVIADLPAKEVA